MLDVNKIIFFGVGAIGASLGAWVAEIYDKTYFLAREKTKAALKANGITHYLYDSIDVSLKEKTISTIHPIQILENLEDISENDVIALGVKNYSLMDVAEQIKSQCDDKPIIVSLANGSINQEILPQFFSKVIYSVVLYNAWRDMDYIDRENKLIVGSQKRGPLLLGTPNNTLLDEMRSIKRIFNQALETIIIDKLQDAVHNKIALNVVNALSTLIGYGILPISDYSAFQILITNTIWEAVQILKAAGFNEYKLPGFTSWSSLEATIKLPLSATQKQFKENMSKMKISSMTQDIIQRDLGVSELESLNGYIVKLAEKHKVSAPYNKTVYNLSKNNFKKGFQPMDVNEVLDEVQKII